MDEFTCDECFRVLTYFELMASIDSPREGCFCNECCQEQFDSPEPKDGGER